MRNKDKGDHLTQKIDPDKLRNVAHLAGIATPDSRTASAMARIAKARKPAPPVTEDEPGEDA